MTIETKVFELRDTAALIPIVASRMTSDDPRERWLLRRAGYSSEADPLVLLSRLGGGPASYDPYDWGGRTYAAAHHHITENWAYLKSGDLIDVRVLLGEATTPCASEMPP